jgi:hypothetical protein
VRVLGDLILPPNIVRLTSITINAPHVRGFPTREHALAVGAREGMDAPKGPAE